MNEPVEQMRAMMQGDLFGHDVRMQTIADEAWFLANDVCKSIGIVDVGVALRKCKDNEKLRRTVYASGQGRRMWFVSEPGLYRLVFLSRKPEAEKFKCWVTHEVLPSIRKSGLYVGDAAGIADVRMRSRDYMALRGIPGSPQGFGHRVASVCRNRSMAFADRTRRGHGWPVLALDAAAVNTTPLRGPLIRPSGGLSVFTFLLDRDVAAVPAPATTPATTPATGAPHAS